MAVLLLVTTAGPIVWGLLFSGPWLADRFCPWLVRRTASNSLTAALLAVGVQLAGMLGFVLATFLINRPAVEALPIWVVTPLFVLAAMLYAPLVGMALPEKSQNPFGALRSRLRRAGATTSQARAAAWAGALPAFLGLAVTFAASASVFGE